MYSIVKQICLYFLVNFNKYGVSSDTIHDMK